MAELDKFVPIEDLAKHFAVSVSTVRTWVRRGHIPKDTYLKIGNTYRFNIPKVIDALTGKHEGRPVPTDSSSPKKESKEPEQLELDFTNPDEDA
jgi:hypothetical protein